MTDVNEEGLARPVRIFVADDHPLFRAALRQVLGNCTDLECIGEASDGLEAIEHCRRLRPDLVLMDVRMPKLDGIEATCEIKRMSPHTIVLMLSALEDPNYLLRALEAGASGYLLKDVGAERISSAIRRVLRGESALNEQLAMRLFMRLIDERRQDRNPAHLVSHVDPPEGKQEPPLVEPLTPREKEVLRLLVHGRTNKQIAKDLFISVSTVKHHVHHIITKLGASDRIHAVTEAIRRGLLFLGAAELLEMWIVDSQGLVL